MSEPAIELQQQVFANLEALLVSLTPGEWAAPTECPGWSVQDNVSHIVGTESMLLGRDAPAHDPGEKPWIRNPIGAGNEIQVDYRRSWPPDKVLDEYREVTRERIDALQGMSADELGAESWTPIGPGTVRDLVAIRVMCSGRVDPTFIVKAFVDGADGVLIAGCHPGDCHYGEGNYKAQRRYWLLMELLDRFGIERERVRLEWISAAEGER